MKRKVVIIYKYISQYRRPFFEQLRDRLMLMNIELVLVYGSPGPIDSKKQDAIDIEWGKKVNNRVFSVAKRELYWQPILPYLKGADLVIVEQANKLLINYLLLMLNVIGLKKVAFWGHGKNFQAKPSSLPSETIKRFLATKVHWWFAYNNLSADVVRSYGFSEERISVVQNAIDSDHLSYGLASLNQSDIQKRKHDLGISGNNVCLYVGGMYPEKRLEYLKEALLLIHSKVPDFEMIFIGSGIDAPLVEDMARTYPWVHYSGPKFENENIPYFGLSKLFLMPGLVGLAILDCFALDLPLVTTKIPYHSPEIEYLNPGINGVMVEEFNSPEAYADEVIYLLTHEDQRQKLVEGCRISKKIYTIDKMVGLFAEGVQKALNYEY
jgi:glycosyltransferase involved in cell wall biosynthesis